MGLVLMILFHFSAQAQCDGSRYHYRVFNAIHLTSDIHYGTNIDFQGDTQELRLDVYEPSFDTRYDRPLIILVHGGSFIIGAKEGPDIIPLAEDLTKMGYVVASIDYRLGIETHHDGDVDSMFAMETVIRSVHDLRAAIRYFKMDYSELGNTFGIDTSKIVIGGVSAGAITAIHTAYLNELSEIPEYIDTSKIGLGGGLEGNSGNAAYTSTGVKGVINICGAIKDTGWMAPNDIPILSLHGDSDQIVPYGTAVIWLLDLQPIVQVDGSHSIDQRAEHLGMQHCLFTYTGADHVPHLDSITYVDTTMVLMRNFLVSLLCDEPMVCEYSNSIDPTDHIALNDRIRVWPNPSTGQVWVGSDLELLSIQLFNRLGQKAYIHNSDTPVLELGQLPRGLYFMVVNTKQGRVAKRLILE